MRRRLFNEYEAFTQEGVDLSDRVRRALAPIFKICLDTDVSMRDVEAITHSEVSCMIAEIMITTAMKRRREERGQ